MSDIKAQAEARRAKILAREKDRLLAAKGEKTFVSSPLPTLPVSSEDASPKKLLNENELSSANDGAVPDSPAPSESQNTSIDGDIPLKDRPLAARRNKIKALQDQIEAQGGVASSADGSSTSDDPPAHLVLPSDLEKTRNEKSEVKIAKEIVIEKKSIDEINAAVAQSTEEFDRTIRSPDKKSIAKKELVTSKNQPHVMQTETMMALVRLVLVVLVGTFLGYFGALVGNKKKLDATVTPSEGRTWSGIFGSPMECAILGIIVIWVFASLIKRPLEKMLGTRGKASTGIIGLVLSIYNHGYDVLLEGLWSSLGEVVLYMTVVLFAGALTSKFNPQEGQTLAPSLSSEF